MAGVADMAMQRQAHSGTEGTRRRSTSGRSKPKCAPAAPAARRESASWRFSAIPSRSTVTSRFMAETRPSGVSARIISRVANGDSGNVDDVVVGQREVHGELRLERRGPERRHRAVHQPLQHPLAVTPHAGDARRGRAATSSPSISGTGTSGPWPPKPGSSTQVVPPSLDGQEHVGARRLGLRRDEQHARRVRRGLDAERRAAPPGTACRARSSSRRAGRSRAWRSRSRDRGGCRGRAARRGSRTGWPPCGPAAARRRSSMPVRPGLGSVPGGLKTRGHVPADAREVGVEVEPGHGRASRAYAGVTGFCSGSFERIQLQPRTMKRRSRASSKSE